ncbi:unnamed protein product [Rodentolepis nana]|uniref:Uncharacterized protein n=1 Tax=Rodentolepis nana TaxID=102285 RepID=A0A3P7V6S1_RODNA|nr:unnamed protein product [Rodentolepis nana]
MDQNRQKLKSISLSLFCPFRLRNEYIAARSQEQAEQIEVRRLRTENGLLLQRLARLEEDNTYLTKQLVDCNLERAQLNEEVSRLRGYIARWQSAQEEAASLRTPTSDSSAQQQSSEASILPLETDSQEGTKDHAYTVKWYKLYETYFLRWCDMTCQDSNTPTASPRNLNRQIRESEPITATTTGAASTSGAESWTSISTSFSPVSIGRSCDERLLVDTIHQLETDLVHLRVRESECHSALRDAKERIQTLEEKLELAKREPEEQIEVLHSELMKVKLREAEGLLKQKELRDRVEEIQTLWENHLALTSGSGVVVKVESSGASQSSGFLRASAGLIQSKLRGKTTVASVADNAQHLSDRLLETKLSCQIAELQQKVMPYSLFNFLSILFHLGEKMRNLSGVNELNSQIDIAERKAMRREELMVDLKEKVERSVLREAALRAELKEAECRCADLETKSNLPNPVVHEGLMTPVDELMYCYSTHELKISKYDKDYVIIGTLPHERKSDAILWRIREIELSSQIAELRQHFSELDCLHDVENASITLQGPPPRGNIDGSPLLSAASSAAPTPAEVRRHPSARVPSMTVGSERFSSMWKDFPPAIMTDSIGPLEDLCIIPDDPLITSIYVQESASKQVGEV